jgi:hypothetical protein
VLDLAPFTQVKHLTRVSTQGSASATQYVQYSLDASTWATLTTNTISLASTGLKQTAWEDIPVLALAPVILRIVAIGGDGSADPATMQSSIMVR